MSGGARGSQRKKNASKFSNMKDSNGGQNSSTPKNNQGMMVNRKRRRTLRKGNVMRQENSGPLGETFRMRREELDCVREELQYQPNVRKDRKKSKNLRTEKDFYRNDEENRPYSSGGRLVRYRPSKSSNEKWDRMRNEENAEDRKNRSSHRYTYSRRHDRRSEGREVDDKNLKEKSKRRFSKGDSSRYDHNGSSSRGHRHHHHHHRHRESDLRHSHRRSSSLERRERKRERRENSDSSSRRHRHHHRRRHDRSKDRDHTPSQERSSSHLFDGSSSTAGRRNRREDENQNGIFSQGKWTENGGDRSGMVTRRVPPPPPRYIFCHICGQRHWTVQCERLVSHPEQYPLMTPRGCWKCARIGHNSCFCSTPAFRCKDCGGVHPTRTCAFDTPSVEWHEFYCATRDRPYYSNSDETFKTWDAPLLNPQDTLLWYCPKCCLMIPHKYEECLTCHLSRPHPPPSAQTSSFMDARDDNAKGAMENRTESGSSDDLLSSISSSSRSNGSSSSTSSSVSSSVSSSQNSSDDDIQP